MYIDGIFFLKREELTFLLLLLLFTVEYWGFDKFVFAGEWIQSGSEVVTVGKFDLCRAVDVRFDVDCMILLLFCNFILFLFYVDYLLTIKAD